MAITQEPTDCTDSTDIDCKSATDDGRKTSLTTVPIIDSGGSSGPSGGLEFLKAIGPVFKKLFSIVLKLSSIVLQKLTFGRVGLG